MTIQYKMMVDKSILSKVYRKRSIFAHKYDFGHLLIIGGSKLYSGSPALAALAAYRAGVDLVTVAAPERPANIIASFSPDMITYPLKGSYLSKKHLKELLKLAENKSAVVIGGGLDRRKETLEGILSFLKEVKLPCVVDAEAIHAIAKDKSVVKKNFVVTPHAREFYVLTGVNLKDLDLNKRVSAARDAALELGATVLLKGNTDIVSDGKKILLNITGNPYMTKGGTGDTLAGILGSLLAQGIDTLTASAAAAYINGKAGDLAAKELKQALTSTDLINYIHKVF